jgi:hypothetical protein
VPPWLIDRRYLWFLAAIPVIGIGVAFFALRNGNSSNGQAPAAVLSTATDVPSPTPTASPTPVRFAALLDGAWMTEAEWNARKDLRPVAVMIDNNEAAYPQSGLDRADLVYEAFVEGGITRFMAVYWSQEADYVEPVRSARTPFVIWASELGALYAHAGSASTYNDADAADQIVEWGVPDLNAFDPVPSSAFYRDDQRYAPHNLVMGTTALRQVAAQMDLPPASPPASWLFKEDGEGTASAPAAGGIQVDLQGNLYASQLVQWKWDPASRRYLRFQSGGPDLDGQTNKQLGFTNVVVMRVPWEVVDDSGHVLLEQIGTGPATVFLDGRAVEGTWKKADRASRTRYYDASGAEIAFNRGPIFIEVVGPESGVLVTPTADLLPPMPLYTPPGSAVGTGGGVDGGVDETAPTPTATPSQTATPVGSGTPRPSVTATVPASQTPRPSATTGQSSTQPPPPASPTTAPTHAAPSPSASPGG